MDNINLENKEALQQKLETLRAKDGFICDMDGVGDIPGPAEQ